MNEDCIFCRIVKGELPAARVFEDEHVLAFMDIGPVVKGHVLVTPKTHHDPLMDTPDEVLARLVAAVKRVARAQVASLQCKGVSVIQSNGEPAGQVVPHIHFHVIPRYPDDGRARGLGQGEYDNNEEMGAYAEKIKQSLA